MFPVQTAMIRYWLDIEFIAKHERSRTSWLADIPEVLQKLSTNILPFVMAETVLYRRAETKVSDQRV